MEQTDARIRKFVYGVRSRLREQCIIDSVISMVTAGLGLGVILSLISLVMPFYYAVPLAAAVVLISFVAGIFWGINRTPDAKQAALLADAKGHKEKISTAFYLAEREDAFSVLQKRDALRVIDGFSVRKEFPLRLSWKRSAMICGLALLFAAGSLFDTPAKQQAAERHLVSKESEKEIAKLEKVEKQIQENKEISETEAGEIKEQIETAKRELKESDSLEELTKAKERVIKKMEMAAEHAETEAFRETLQNAAAEAKEQDELDRQELAKKAEEALEKAKNGSRRDKQEAYEKLSELAGKLSDEELKEAAEAYKESGDSYAMENALAAATKRMEGNGRDLANNQASVNASQNNGNGQNQMSAGNQNSGNNGQNQTSGQGDGSQEGNGTNPGSNGAGGAGSGTGANNNGAGNNGGNGAGAGWNRGSKQGQEGPAKTAENITIPDGELGDDENLTGKAVADGAGTKQKSEQSQAWSGNKVSYGQVSGSYKDKAYKRIEGANYPGRMKDKIRNYFDGLN